MDLRPTKGNGLNGGFSRKKQILEKATSLFREKGYASSSVRDLAQKAGIEAPSLYSHFKSKEDILEQICFKMAVSFLDGMDKVLNGNSVEEQLSEVIKEHARVVISNKEASAVMWNEWKFLRKPKQSEFRDMKKSYEERFTNIISDGLQKGILRENDPEVLSSMILSSLNSLALWFNSSDEETIERFISKLPDIYLKGILK